jgi:predicted ATPase
MLTELRLKNFKCFGNKTTVNLKPITLIFGPNSAGKSTVIQSLMLLRQSLDPTVNPYNQLIFRGHYTDLGSYKAAVYKHELNRDLKIGVSFSWRGKNIDREPLFWNTNTKGHTRAVDWCFTAAQETGGSSSKLTAGAVSSIKLTLKDKKNKSKNFQVVSMKNDEPFKDNFEEGLSSSDIFGFKTNKDQNEFIDFIFSLEEKQFDSWLIEIREELKRLTRRKKQVEELKEEDLKSSTTLSAIMAERRQRDLEKISKDIADVKRLIKTPPDKKELLDPDILKVREKWKKEAKKDPIFFSQWGLLIGFPSKPKFLDTLQFQRVRSTRTNTARTMHRVSRNFGLDIHYLFRNLTYLGPLRSPPERHYVITGGTIGTVGKTGQNTPRILVRSDRKFKQNVNKWLKKLGIRYNLSVKQIGTDVTGDIATISLQDRETKVTVGPSDVGFGIGQLLPVLIEGLSTEPKVICVEQPEIHLHPRLQANLADFLIETSNSNQWIIETHSEALILRLKRRIKEGNLKAENVSLLYVNPGPDGAEIVDIGIDEEGNFINEWPDGFFEESFDEIFGLSS